MDEKDQAKQLEEDSWDARIAMLDAKRREEMLGWEKHDAARQELYTAAAKDSAKTEQILRDIDADRAARGPLDKSGELSITEEQETRFRADHISRLAKYAREAIEASKRAVEEVKIEPVVASLIVSERTASIKKAAKQDRENWIRKLLGRKQKRL